MVQDRYRRGRRREAASGDREVAGFFTATGDLTVAARKEV
jgi:hypothetical protein